MKTNLHLLPVALLLLAASTELSAAGGDAPGRLPLLIPDDFAELRLCGWRVEPGTPDPRNPLIEGEMPWDRGGVGIHGSVFKDPLDQRWKAYLVCTPAEELPEKQPENQGKPWASENHAHRRVCLFESEDGLKWNRSLLDTVPFGEHKRTNILFDVNEGVSAYASVLVDPAQRDWPYEMFVLRESWGAVKGKAPKGNGYYRYRSKDGRRWESTGQFVNDPMKGDLCFFYRDPDEGYVAYYRLGGPRQPTDHVPAYEDFPRRSCFRAVSRDGIKWARDPLMLLTADERDHRDTQYQECVPLRVPGGHVALVTMYHPLTQTLNLRLAASRDGRRWWFPDRRPCLDNAPLGDYGGGMIWQSQYLILDGGKLYVYYGGTEGPHRQISDTRAPSKEVGPHEKVIDHGAHFLPFNAALCRASWRADRLYALASSAGGPTLGIAITTPRPLGGKKLFVNLLTRPAKRASEPGLDEGALRVELLDAAGQPLPGFTRDDCPPLRGDHAALAVGWKGGEVAPEAARQARFFLKRAFLYGFAFRGDTPGQNDKPPARPSPADQPKALDIGDRRELFVDDWLVSRRDGLELRLQSPVPREVVLTHDAPWEGSGCGYHTIFRDGDVVRMYYIAGDLTNEEGTKLASRPFVACYAESKDGIHWVKPELGLFEFAGSKKNNIIWAAKGLDNFTPFKDPNPDCRPGERYKAVSSGPGGLLAYKSADGIRWAPLVDRPIITRGAFDTQNNAFWDPLRKHYWCYVRDFHKGIRDIRVATSADFRTWTEPQPLAFVDSPDEALYTNQVQPYYRAPHLFVGFPTRYVERPGSPALQALPDPEHRRRRMQFHPRFGTAVTDGLFMTSRDGRTFRRWDEAFLRPGPERKHNWLYGDGYQNLGLLETAASDPSAPPELSLYVIEDNWKRATRLRRWTLRLDGFVALHARQKGGELVTRPLVFRGKELTLNFATSAAGQLRVELQDAAGQPLPGFTLADGDELFGDTLDRAASWRGKTDVSPLAGKPILLRLTLREADLFSLRFR
jgi:hypothetical protein